MMKQGKKRRDGEQINGGFPILGLDALRTVTEAWAGVYRAGRCGRLEMEKERGTGEGVKTLLSGKPGGWEQKPSFWEGGVQSDG